MQTQAGRLPAVSVTGRGAIVAVIVLFILSLGLRWHDFRQETGTEISTPRITR